MLTHFVEDTPLSDEELRQLRQLLDAKQPTQRKEQ